MPRRLLASAVAASGALSLLVIASAVFAAAPRAGVVKTKGGLTYAGQVEETDDGVTITTTGGITTSIKRDEIDQISYGSFKEVYEKERRALKDDDALGRVKLARKAFDAGESELALTTLDDALTIDPNNAEAAELQRLIIGQRRLTKGNTGDDKGDTPDDPNAGKTPADEGTATSKPTTAEAAITKLDDEQINRIRQVEVQPSDRVSIRFENQVKQNYVKANPDLSFADFSRLPIAEQAIRIIEKGGDMAKDVKINSDPASIRTFRRQVMPMMIAGCATSGCHGGQNTHGLPILSPANDAASAYTNFYTLQQYKQKQEGASDKTIFAGGELAMIDRTTPDRSLLLQYGLPLAQADFKHPKVANFNAIFGRGKADPQYRATLEWITKSLRPVMPDYKIEKDKTDAETK